VLLRIPKCLQVYLGKILESWLWNVHAETLVPYSCEPFYKSTFPPDFVQVPFKEFLHIGVISVGKEI
jgi:hypothetical protein